MIFIFNQSVIYNRSLHANLYTVFFVAADIDLFLVVDQSTHLAHHACVLGVEGEDYSVDEEHETDAEEDYEVGLGLSEEHVGAAVYVV